MQTTGGWGRLVHNLQAGRRRLCCQMDEVSNATETFGEGGLQMPSKRIKDVCQYPEKHSHPLSRARQARPLVNQLATDLLE